MADQKASILMGASFVVFSIAVGRSLAGELPWPLAVLALFAFLSSLCAAIAVLPSVEPAAAAGRDATGCSSAISRRSTRRSGPAACSPSCTTDEGVFRLMLHDIYQNGQVLQRRKYRFLRYAYRAVHRRPRRTLASFVIEMTGS
jgi:hypothetical protein